MNTSHLPTGRRVRAELALRGLGTKDLARLFGVAPNTMSRRLRGVTPFAAQELAAISAWLDVPVERFFDPVPERPAAVAS